MSDKGPGLLGTALTEHGTKVMMLGSGELGKEVVIELQRLGSFKKVTHQSIHIAR